MILTENNIYSLINMHLIDKYIIHILDEIDTCMINLKLYIWKMLGILLIVFSQTYVKHDLRKNKIVVASTTSFLKH
jgi:hypothetical protein